MLNRNHLHTSVGLLLFGLLIACSKQNTLDDSGTAVTGRVVQGSHSLASATVRVYGASKSILRSKSASRQQSALSPDPSLDSLTVLLDTTSSQPDGSYALNIGAQTGPLRIEVTQGDSRTSALSALIIAGASDTLVANVNELTTLAKSVFNAKYGSSQPVTAVSLGIAETATQQLFHLPSTSGLTAQNVATTDDPTTTATRGAQMLAVVSSALNQLAAQGLSIDSIAADAASGNLGTDVVAQINTTITTSVAAVGLDDSSAVPSASSSVAFVGTVSDVSPPVYSTSSDGTLGLAINFPPVDGAATYTIQLSDGTCAAPGATLDTQSALVANADNTEVDYALASGLTPDNSYCLSISAQDDDGSPGTPYTVDLAPTAP